jgi:trehalose 6-phosphate phosphatase
VFNYFDALRCVRRIAFLFCWQASSSSRTREGGMKIAEQNDIYAPFLERVRRASTRVLLLDYDGTLAPFTIDRKRAFPYHEIPELVSEIMASGTRVVLVSGREARELLFLSGIHPQPEIWGSHGMERLHADGAYTVAPLAPEHKRALEAADHALRAAGLSDRMEGKPGSIAVHWRGMPHERQMRIARRVRDISTTAVRDSGLELLSFDGGLELRAPGKTKGDAVETILAEAGVGTAAAYLGDDETDENAFRAIKARGLAVLVRLEPRPTLADVWLQPPGDLIAFLRDWLAACGSER